MSTLLSPTQVELITAAWSESNPFRLNKTGLERSASDIRNCFVGWNTDDLAESSEAGIEDNLLTTLAKQTYLGQDHSNTSVRLLINLISAYRLALTIEGLVDFKPPNKRSNSDIDWLSLCTMDATRHLSTGTGDEICIDKNFSSQYRAYIAGTEVDGEHINKKDIRHVDYRIIDSHSRSHGYGKNLNRAVVQSYCIEYTYEITGLRHEDSARIILAYDDWSYKVSDNKALLRRIVEYNAIAINSAPEIGSYMLQSIGRALTVDETQDWTDLLGLPALAVNPIFHLGRTAHFFVYIIPRGSSAIASISRPSLLQEDLTYLGMLDTFGSVQYFGPWNTIGAQCRSLEGNIKSSRLSVSLELIIPGINAYSARSSPEQREDGNAHHSYFLDKVLNGSAFLHSSTREILRSQADLVSLRYFIECGASYANLSPAIVNGSFLVTEDQKIRVVWRFEPNFNSWSGRMVDSFRTMCRIFLFQSEPPNQDGYVSELNLMGFPDDSWIEDIRLFEEKGRLLGTAALFMPSLTLNQPSLDNSSNNTGTGMVVSQCLVEIDSVNSLAHFIGFINIRKNADGVLAGIPTCFEKNWSIWKVPPADRLVYSIDPWLSFEKRDDDWHYLESNLTLQPSIKSILGATPRLSCHFCPLPKNILGEDTSIGFFHIRDQNYSYRQYLFHVDNATGRPLGWNSKPFLCIDSDFPSHDYLPTDFRIKNKGVCYLCSISILNGRLHMLVNMFDSELYMMSISLEHALALLTSDADGYYSFNLA